MCMCTNSIHEGWVLWLSYQCTLCRWHECEQLHVHVHTVGRGGRNPLTHYTHHSWNVLHHLLQCSAHYVSVSCHWLLTLQLQLSLVLWGSEYWGRGLATPHCVVAWDVSLHEYSTHMFICLLPPRGDLYIGSIVVSRKSHVPMYTHVHVQVVTAVVLLIELMVKGKCVWKSRHLMWDSVNVYPCAKSRVSGTSAFKVAVIAHLTEFHLQGEGRASSPSTNTNFPLTRS